MLEKEKKKNAGFGCTSWGQVFTLIKMFKFVCVPFFSLFNPAVDVPHLKINAVVPKVVLASPVRKAQADTSALFPPKLFARRDTVTLA